MLKRNLKQTLFVALAAIYCTASFAAADLSDLAGSADDAAAAAANNSSALSDNAADDEAMAEARGGAGGGGQRGGAGGGQRGGGGISRPAPAPSRPEPRPAPAPVRPDPRPAPAPARPDPRPAPAPRPAPVHYDPVRISGGRYDGPAWNHPTFSRPVYNFEWTRIQLMTCTAISSNGDEFPVTENDYTGIEYEQNLDAIEDAALDLCYQDTDGDSSCSLLNCTPEY